MASSSLATDDFDQYFASLEPSTAGFMDHDWLSLRETLPLDIASTSEPVLGDGDLPIPIAWLMVSCSPLLNDILATLTYGIRAMRTGLKPPSIF